MWRPLLCDIVISVFADESSDSKKERVFAVAGLLADAAQWSALERRWRERTKGEVFHAADCESPHGKMGNLSHEERLRLHRDLTVLLAESGIIGWGAAIDLAGAKAAFPDAKPQQSYFSCFVRTVNYLGEKARLFVPRDDLEFTFDINREIEHTAGKLYDHLVNTGDWTTGETFVARRVSFASRSDFGIQAADLWARELMKRCDSFLLDDRSIPRLQWTTLRNTNRFGGDFICSGYFADFRARYFAIAEETGMQPDGYWEWLRRLNLQDSQSNRIEYFMRVDAEQRRGKIEDAQ